MGVYLVSADTEFLEDDSPWVAVFALLDDVLAEMGIDGGIQIPRHQRRPRGTGHRFEEKLIPPLGGFSALCKRELNERDAAVFGWDLLVPVDFDGVIELPLAGNYHSSRTRVRSAQRLLPVAKRLAEVIKLPAEVPMYCDNLQLTSYFMDFEEDGNTASVPAGPWRDDLGTAFWVAVSLRAAEHSIRLRCPLLLT